jgi:hypothetical protein
MRLHSTLLGSHSSKPALALPALWPPVLVLPASVLDAPPRDAPPFSAPAALPATLESAASCPELPAEPPVSLLLPQATARQSRQLQTRNATADERTPTVYTNQRR